MHYFVTYFLVYWAFKTCKAGCQLFFQWLPRLRGMFVHKSFKTTIPDRHFIDPSSKDVSRSQLHDQSFSINASKVTHTQYDDSSIDVPPGTHRAPKDSRVLGPDNTPVASFELEPQVEVRSP